MFLSQVLINNTYMHNDTSLWKVYSAMKVYDTILHATKPCHSTIHCNYNVLYLYSMKIGMVTWVKHK